MAAFAAGSRCTPCAQRSHGRRPGCAPQPCRLPRTCPAGAFAQHLRRTPERLPAPPWPRLLPAPPVLAALPAHTARVSDALLTSKCLPQHRYRYGSALRLAVNCSLGKQRALLEHNVQLLSVFHAAAASRRGCTQPAASIGGPWLRSTTHTWSKRRQHTWPFGARMETGNQRWLLRLNWYLLSCVPQLLEAGNGQSRNAVACCSQ